MKKLFSTRLSDSSFSFAMLLLRLGFGGVMITHGLSKIQNFNQILAQFPGQFGMSPTVSLYLLIFAEFFCSILIVIGLATRLAAIPLIFAMCVAFFKAHNGDIKVGEVALLYLVAFLVILIAGPGKISVDRSIGKSKL